MLGVAIQVKSVMSKKRRNRQRLTEQKGTNREGDGSIPYILPTAEEGKRRVKCRLRCKSGEGD